MLYPTELPGPWANQRLIVHAAIGILSEPMRAIVTVQVANPNTAGSVRHECDARSVVM
jgi:hypothetical protein